MEYRIIRKDDELMHYGVLGMKWGHRKAPTAHQTRISNAKAAYKTANKDLKTARKEYRKNAGLFGQKYVGINGLSKANKAAQKIYNAEMNKISAEAQYKAAKAKTASKAEKAEFNTYRKEMQKSGLVGSAADTQSGGRSTRLYNEISVKKGKKYADKVQKKVQDVAYAEIATAAVVTIGSAAVSGYLSSRN